MRQKCGICGKWCASPNDVGSDDAYCYGNCEAQPDGDVTHACDWCEKFVICYERASALAVPCIVLSALTRPLLILGLELSFFSA